MAADRPALCDLVKDLRLSEALLQDLDRFYESRRDPVRFIFSPPTVQLNHQTPFINEYQT